MKNSKKGFTLVEIMIVVVIIGLLAAMAIPAFQKVRENSIGKSMANDARQLAGAGQQYILENPGEGTTVALDVDTATGAVSGPLSEYVRTISKGTDVSAEYDGNAAAGVEAFNMTNPQYNGGAAQSYDTEGKEVN